MAQLTEDTFEPLLRLVQETVAIDLRQAAFIDPYGMVGLLEIGEFLKREGGRRALCLPDEEVLSYLERMDFFREARTVMYCLRLRP